MENVTLVSHHNLSPAAFRSISITPSMAGATPIYQRRSENMEKRRLLSAAYLKVMTDAMSFM